MRYRDQDGAAVRGLGDFVAATAALSLSFVLLAADARAQAQQAGVTAAVRGSVELASAPGTVGRLVKSGEPIYLGNAIKSGPDSGLQILLLDQTTFTIGPDSELTIDQFVYDPNTGAGKVSASVAKGVFRFVTGKVAQTNPSDMQVKIPSGTIGIRGTIAMGSATPGNEQVVLVGPGRDLEGSNRAGALLLTSYPRKTADAGSRPQLASADAQAGFALQIAQGGPGGGSGGGDQVTIDRPGFGSVVGPQGWGGATFFTPEMLAALTSRLTPTGGAGQQGQGQGQAQGGQAAQNAGTAQTEGKEGSQLLNSLAQTLNTAQTLNSDASQDQIKDQTLGTTTLNGITGLATFGQVRTLSGQFHFAQNNVPISDGFYNININVDAGKREFGSDGSFLTIKTSTVNGTGYVTPFSYNNSSTFPDNSPAAGFPDGKGDFYGTACGSSGICDVKLLVAFLNAGGQIAGKMFHGLEVLTDQDVSLFSGSGIASATPGFGTDPNKLADSQSTYEQMRVQNAGKYNYAGGANLAGSLGSGSYTFKADIDFGQRTFGGGNSKLVVTSTAPGGYGGTVPIGSQNWAASVGAANFQQLFVGGGFITGTACAGACNSDFALQPQNVGGVLAGTANHQVTVRSASVSSSTGSGTGATRFQGVAPP